MRELTPDERMLLLRFVCAFAWADRVVRAEERDALLRLSQQLR